MPSAEINRPPGDMLRSIFAEALNRVDRLPALQTAFERVAAICADAMRDAGEPEFALRQIEIGLAAGVLAHHEGASVTAVVNAPQWNTRMLVSVDRPCVFAVVETSLGGDGTQAPYDASRPFSKIELAVLRRFFGRLVAAIEAAFAPIAKSAFVLEDVSDRVDFDILGRRTSTVVTAKLALRVWGQEGEILVVVPKAAIDPMRETFGRPVVEETKRPDPRWSTKITDEITRTSVVLSGILEERLIPLQEVAGLKIGQIMRLEATPQTRVRVECNGQPLLWCELGKTNDAYTLRVDKPVDPDEEFMNDLLAG